MEATIHLSGSPNMVLSFTWKLVKRQILWLNPSLSESETLKLGPPPQNLCFNKPPSDPNAHQV